MQTRRLRWLLWTADAIWIAAFVCFAFGFERSEYRQCAHCWGSTRIDEIGLALSQDARWTLRRCVVAGAPLSGVARFLPLGHVHDDAASDWWHWQRMYGFHGKFGGRSLVPSEFAAALCDDPALGDFVEARVADGTVDLATVQELIAVPSSRQREDDWCGEHLELLRKGVELHAAFKDEDPRQSKFWHGVDPYDWPPPVRGCPNMPPR